MLFVLGLWRKDRPGDVLVAESYKEGVRVRFCDEVRKVDVRDLGGGGSPKMKNLMKAPMNKTTEI